jgi:hypothetical protein
MPLPTEGSIVECEPILDDGGAIRWRIKLVRTDKNYPNDALTFKNTVRDIHEKITYEELVTFARDLERSVYSKQMDGRF